MAQQVKAPAAKLEAPSSIPDVYTVEGKFASDPHTWAMTHTPQLHTKWINKQMQFLKI